MRRVQLAVAAGLGLAALAVPASAGFGPQDLDNQYEGRAERDPLTYVGFNIVKKQGEQKVAKLTAHLPYTCDNGDSGRARARVKGKLRVSADRFAGTLRVTRVPVEARGGSSPGRIKYRVKGKLQENGKAKGEIDAEIRFTPTKMRGGGDQVRCYTGRLDWKAKRGADLDVEVLN